MLICALIFIAFIIAIKIYTINIISQKTEKTNTTFFKQPDTTEVFVLGTLHRTTEKVDYNDLYNLLEIIKPNLILFETDSLYFDNNMNLKSKWWKVILPKFLDKFKQSNLEEFAVQKYIFHNKYAIVRPYEWSNRDKFHKENRILTTPNKVFQKLEKLNSTNQLSTNQKNILEDYYNLTNQLEDFGENTLYEINTAFQDSIARGRQNAQYHKIKTIIDSNDNLIEFREFYRINEKYWDIRNLAMVSNIEKYIKLYPNTRIVVLNGYYHRYYLRHELKKKEADLNFLLKEIEH